MNHYSVALGMTIDQARDGAMSSHTVQAFHPLVGRTLARVYLLVTTLQSSVPGPAGGPRTFPGCTCLMLAMLGAHAGCNFKSQWPSPVELQLWSNLAQHALVGGQLRERSRPVFCSSSANIRGPESAQHLGGTAIHVALGAGHILGRRLSNSGAFGRCST